MSQGEAPGQHHRSRPARFPPSLASLDVTLQCSSSARSPRRDVTFASCVRTRVPLFYLSLFSSVFSLSLFCFSFCAPADQALSLLEHLVKNGAERVIEDARDNLHRVRMLADFNYYEGPVDKGSGGACAGAGVAASLLPPSPCPSSFFWDDPSRASTSKRGGASCAHAPQASGRVKFSAFRGSPVFFSLFVSTCARAARVCAGITRAARDIVCLHSSPNTVEL